MYNIFCKVYCIWYICIINPDIISGFFGGKTFNNFNMKTKTRVLQNLMTIGDYAKDKGVTIQTIYNWVKEGRVKTVNLYGKSLIDITTFRG